MYDSKGGAVYICLGWGYTTMDGPLRGEWVALAEQGAGQT